MLILALDTSSAAGSAAVVRDGRIVVERAGDRSRTHGQRLPAELMDVLAAAATTLDAVDAFAVITGPGSFTGLRVGIATVQGLAFARERPVYPVSTFDALAWHARASGRATAIWIDAHRGEIFATLRDPSGATLAPPSSRPPGATLDAWDALLDPSGARFVGDGAVRYRDDITARLGSRAEVEDRVPLLAGIAGALAEQGTATAVRPHAVVPQYVRRPDAELARDRRKFD